jgi:hypothetical protein
MLFGRAIENGATKKGYGCKLFSEAVNIEIFIKKRVKYKNRPIRKGFVNGTDSIQLVHPAAIALQHCSSSKIPGHMP